jgi:hypothetical protein
MRSIFSLTCLRAYLQEVYSIDEIEAAIRTISVNEKILPFPLREKSEQ